MVVTRQVLHAPIYRLSHDERSIFWKVIVSVTPSKKLYTDMCPIPFSLYSSEIVDKKEILRAVSNTGIYCSSDKVGTVYLLWYIFENSTININTLCNSCEESIQHICILSILHNAPTVSLSTVTTANWRFALIHMREGRTTLCAKSKLLYSEIILSRKTFGIGHMYIHNFSLRMTDTTTSQNIDLSSWDTLYAVVLKIQNVTEIQK
jgi:hypothetical protein